MPAADRRAFSQGDDYIAEPHLAPGTTSIALTTANSFEALSFTRAPFATIHMSPGWSSRGPPLLVVTTLPLRTSKSVSERTGNSTFTAGIVIVLTRSVERNAGRVSLKR